MYRCQACRQLVFQDVHTSVLLDRASLDDKTFAAVDKDLCLSTAGAEPGTVDGCGNPVVCRMCLVRSVLKTRGPRPKVKKP